ncbi:hypothetical protein F8M41_002088 [Gigaspora margarita]|uniref:Uncharacterized protein n=1 Tax=Gigaspora margarita TaxID=4874 RepID=A0A8H3XE30_GIGMA|nr:hypothetical protein F8M41_002088 [Gigaspora margarita]
MNLRSPIFQGIILGWAAIIILLILALAAGTNSQRENFNVIWDLRVGLLLTAVTIITKSISFVAGFMVPAILSGMLALNRISNLSGPGTSIIQLMEASMSHSLSCTLKTCFTSSKTRKLAVAIVLVFAWQYSAAIANLSLHATAVGNPQKLPGLVIQNPMSLEIATNCSDTALSDNCVARKRGMKNQDKALEVYYNISDSLKIWKSNGGVYLLQSPPPEQAYSYSGSAVFLRPSCKPISSACNLRSINSNAPSINCPKTLWSATGDLFNTNDTSITNVGINVTNMNLISNRYLASNPIQAINFARYVKDYSTNYDSEFVRELNGNITILLHCQILASTVDYVVTLGSLKASPRKNLTNSQLFNLGVASSQYLKSRLVRDIEIVSYTGNSTLFADAFAQRWAYTTISAFSVMVQGNGTGGGSSYTLEEDKDQSVVPLLVILAYAFVIIFPLLIFSILSLFSLRNSHINWTLAESLCTPQRLFYQLLIGAHHVNDGCLNSLTEQEKVTKNIECNIREEGHLELIYKG